MSQAQLGARAGMTQQAVQRFEAQRQPVIEKLTRIARALGVSEQALIGPPAAGGGARSPLDAAGEAGPPRLDGTLLRRVVLFVGNAERAQAKARGEAGLSETERAAQITAVYEMAWRDCRELGLEPATIALDRYLPAVEMALEHRAA